MKNDVNALTAIILPLNQTNLAIHITHGSKPVKYDYTILSDY